MNLKAINGNQWVCLPVVGSIWGLLYLTWAVFRGAAEKSAEEQNTQYEVTYEDRYGNRETKIESGTGIGALLAGGLIIYLLYLAGTTFISVLKYIASSPLILFFPLFIIGLCSYFYRERIEHYGSNRIYDEDGLSITFWLAIILSFYIPTQVIGRMDFIEFLFIYLPLVVMFFFGLLGPLAFSITLVSGFYKSTVKSRGLVALIFTRMNLVLIGAMCLSIYAYYWINDVSSVKGFTQSVNDYVQFTYEQLNTELAKERGIRQFGPYWPFIGICIVYLSIPSLISFMLRRASLTCEEVNISMKLVITIISLPALLSLLYWGQPNFAYAYLTPDFLVSVIEPIRVNSFEREYGMSYQYQYSLSLAADVIVFLGLAFLYFTHRTYKIMFDFLGSAAKHQIVTISLLIYASFASLGGAVVWATEKSLKDAIRSDTFAPKSTQSRKINSQTQKIALTIFVVEVDKGGQQLQLVTSAKIRIMNIKPSYKPGVVIAPGNYDIEVSAKGYETSRRWYKLSQPIENIEIQLRKE